MTPDNRRLHQEMLDNGYSIKETINKRHYIDSDGNYVSFPVGYITGPSYVSGSLNPYYCSVQGETGWHQRTGSTPEEVREWAIQEQKEILS
jgi:hypothetical protein